MRGISITKHKHTKAAFHDALLVQEKLRDDPEFSKRMTDTVNEFCKTMVNGRFDNPFSCYDFFKERGFEDEEIVFAFGLATAQAVVRQMTGKGSRISSLVHKDNDRAREE